MNSLGYFYYYCLGVEKYVQKDFDYFNIGITYKDSAAVLDTAYLLIQNLNNDKKLIETDIFLVYTYVSNLAGKDFTFGTYFYVMMNQYI